MGNRLPLAKHEELLVEQLNDELVVYDHESDQVHCLNASAAIVFAACNGRTSFAEASARMPGGTEPLVWLALQQLDQAHLLQGPLSIPAGHRALSRRELELLPGMDPKLLPQVESIAAPSALAAASKCFGSGRNCNQHFDCCSDICVDNGPGPGSCA